MAIEFEFELVTPERLLISKEVMSVVVPGEEGDIGVLEGHSPFLSSLRPGVVLISEEENQPPEKVVIAGGFTEILPDRVTVMVDHATTLEEIDVEDQKAKLAEAEKQMAAIQDEDPRFVSWRNQADYAQACLDLVKKGSH